MTKSKKYNYLIKIIYYLLDKLCLKSNSTVPKGLKVTPKFEI